jgi:hypothetical protein
MEQALVAGGDASDKDISVGVATRIASFVGK